jgi:hypothetical protein
MDHSLVRDLIEKRFREFLFKVINAKDNVFVQSFFLGKLRNEGWDGDNQDFLTKFLGFSNDIKMKEFTSLSMVLDRAGMYIKNVEQRMSHSIASEVLASKNVLKDIISPEIATAYQQGITAHDLAVRLKSKTKNYFYNFEMMARTELNFAKNIGSLNSILENNKGKDPEEIRVYFLGRLSEKTCDFCKDMYHNGNSFKVYKLSEVLKNGSPVGKNLRKEKGPFLPPIHPLCVHTMVELRKNFELNSQGIPIFVGNKK